MDEIPELEADDLWDAVGTQDWERVEEILKEAGYALEDLGMLAIAARDDEEVAA